MYQRKAGIAGIQFDGPRKLGNRLGKSALADQQQAQRVVGLAVGRRLADGTAQQVFAFAVASQLSVKLRQTKQGRRKIGSQPQRHPISLFSFPGVTHSSVQQAEIDL